MEISSKLFSMLIFSVGWGGGFYFGSSFLYKQYCRIPFFSLFTFLCLPPTPMTLQGREYSTAKFVIEQFFEKCISFSRTPAPSL